MKKSLYLVLGIVCLLLAGGLVLISCDLVDGCPADQKCSWGWNSRLSKYDQLSGRICNYTSCNAAKARADYHNGIGGSYSAGCTGDSCK